MSTASAVMGSPIGFETQLERLGPPVVTAPNPLETEAPSASRFDRLRTAALGTVAALTGALALNGAANTSTAEAAAPLSPPETTVTATIKGETKTSTVNVEDVASGKTSILINYSAKGMSKRQHRRLEAQNRCRTFNGKKVMIHTKGLPGGGPGQYGRDLRTSRFCKVNGKWVRVRCKNPAFVETPPPPRMTLPTPPIFVKHAKGSVPIVARAEAVAQCVTSDGTASAYAKASGSATGSVSLKNFIYSRGHNTIHVRESATIKARTTAIASVSCSTLVIHIEGKQPEVVTKDGTKNPPTPTPAPAPNPAPSPQEPYPGGYRCYSETTGAPVAPRPDQTCPPGSWGGTNTRMVTI